MRRLIGALIITWLAAATAQQAQTGAMDSTRMPAGQPAAAVRQHPCIQAPRAAACRQFTYPSDNAAQDIASLCRAMPFMGACSVLKACNASGAAPDALTTAGLDAANSSMNSNSTHMHSATDAVTPAGLTALAPNRTDTTNSSSALGGANSSALGLAATNGSSWQGVSANNSAVCDPWQLVVTVCRLDKGMGRMPGEACGQ